MLKRYTAMILCLMLLCASARAETLVKKWPETGEPFGEDVETMRVIVMGIGARNLGALMAMRGIYFVPFGQDDPIKKPQSLVAHFDRLVDAARAALNGEQLQPLLI